MNVKDPQRISKIAKDLLLNDERFKGQTTIGVTDCVLIKEIYMKAGYKEKTTFHSMTSSVMNRLQVESKRENPLFEMQWVRATRLVRKFILK